MDPLSVKRRLSCILAADAVGYSRQMEQDEESTIRVLAAHRAVIDGIITFHGGRIMSTAGDSVLAEFSSVVEAVRCAVEIQEALKTRNDALPDKSQMHFRVGVNLGDVVVKNDDLLGDGVNVAARLETIAEPGGICISSSVYDQITGKLDLGFQDIGEQTLKNISRPIRVYRVSGTAKPQRSAPPAPAERRAHGSLPWAIAGVVVAIAGLAAWQLGWLSFGAPGRGSPGAPAPVAAPAASAPSLPPRADREATTADAATVKQETQVELARARSEAEAARAAKAQADAEAAANRVRSQALADAARIRADAVEAAARTRTNATAATRDAASQAAPAATPAPRTAPSAPADTAVAATASIAADKIATAPAVATAGGARFDGAWSVSVACEPMGTGALGYKFDFVAQVKDNFLRGERRAEGSPGWLKL
ncbi:MAG TPA: adenylate/guanylate cyclase domain-containing protein, partial [Casimicrobiaceae bacterium]|nr:adenylate/guanylate cyclase domain-containing protein [Casimicrobiaceae bacterium]